MADPTMANMDGHPKRKQRARLCLIDRCAMSAPGTIVVAAALMIPVVALIDALR